MLTHLLPLLAVAVPLLSIPFIILWGNKSNKASGIISLISNLIVLFFVLELYPQVVSGKILHWQSASLVKPFYLSYRVDGVAFVVAIASCITWIISGVFSIKYLESGHNKKRYYIFSNIILASCLGVIFSGDMFTLFLFFEAMSILSYALVAFDETSQSIVAANVYLLLGLVGSACLLFSIILTYRLTGTVSFGSGGILSSSTQWIVLIIMFISYTIGFGIKSGMFPFHVWLPDIYPVMPAPASTLFSCVILKVGALGLIRVVYNIYGVSLFKSTGAYKILLVFAAITIFWGSAVALGEMNLKRRLAYSSIGQMGYILLGIGIATPLGLTGALYHVFNHSIMKSALCLAIGGVYYKTHAKNVDDLDNMGVKMPLTMAVFSLAAFAITGVPGLNGFIGKWDLSLASIQAGRPIYIIFLLLSSLMNGLYYFPLVIKSFFNSTESKMAVAGYGSRVTKKIDMNKAEDSMMFASANTSEALGHDNSDIAITALESKEQELPLGMLIPLLVLATFMLLYGLFPDAFPLNIIQNTVKILF